MGSNDAAETAHQKKKLETREKEAQRAKERESKRQRVEEELQERVEMAEAEVAMAEAEEAMAKEMEDGGGESTALNEESLQEVAVDPSFESRWIDQQIRSQAHQQNRTPLPTVASIAIRGEGSRRFVAAIATATLVDYNVVTADNTSQIITKDKIQRELDRLIESNNELIVDEDSPITCLLFDGRNDKTKVMLEDERGKRYPSTVVEEHVSLVSEPGGKYVGHLTPTAKDAKTQAEEIYRFLVENGIDKTLQYIGGDSTNVNTGAHGGIMHYVEELLGHRLGRIICELHTNELPLRHIIEAIDGPTSGANSFSGTVYYATNEL